MIYPKKNKFIRLFFDWYINRIIAANFREVNYNNISINAGKSVLLVANHFSWWDGFLMYHINKKLIKKNFHVMVVEDTVKKVSFFKYMGAFSVNKQSRDVLTSIQYAAQLLANAGNLVLIFPQGKLYSNFVDEISFEKGLEKITQQAAGKYQLVMAATFVESMQYKKSTANVYLDVADDTADIRAAYQQHYKAAHTRQIQKSI